MFIVNQSVPQSSSGQFTLAADGTVRTQTVAAVDTEGQEASAQGISWPTVSGS